MTLPESHLLTEVLERAQHDLDIIDRDRLAIAITKTWEATEHDGHHRCKWVALALLYRAGLLRRRDPHAPLADALDQVAEAFVLSWAGEVDALASLAALDHD